MCLYSSMSCSSNVRISDCNLSAENCSCLRSIKHISLTWYRNEIGCSIITCCTLILVFKYSINRFKNCMKCCACLMLPGIASFSTSNGSIGFAIISVGSFA
eukprot:NODE_702_length_5024_cov_0.139898.p3 type:complete len:101 gc:universal NODE_702_length_5024_cov_0.139898:1441-1743(+)